MAEQDSRLARLTGLVADERVAAVERLRRRLADDAFCYGLVQGSPVLFGELAKWLAGPPGAAPDRQALSRLVKYLARVTAKTSPYSTFTVVGVGVWSDGPVPLVRPTGDWAWRSEVELNVWLVQRFARFAMRHPAVVPELRLRVNPSLTEDGRALRFLGAGPGTPLISLGRGQAVAECVEFVAGTPVPTVAALRAHLSAVDPQLPPADVARFVGKLVDIGLLHAQPPFTDRDADHLGRLTDWLAAFDAPEMVRLRNSLAGIAHELREYPGLTDPGARLAAHERVYGELGRLDHLDRHGAEPGSAEPGPLPRKNLFHENAVFTAAVVECGRDAWQPVIDDLSALRGILPLFDVALPARRALADVFRAVWPSAAAVPWLAFYQEVGRLVAAGAGAVRGGIDGASLGRLCGGRAATPQDVWPTLPYAGEQSDLLARATRLVRSGSPDRTGTVDVDLAAITGLATGLPPSLARTASLSCYVQVVDPDLDVVVLNVAGVGYGRGLTRMVRLAGGTAPWHPYEQDRSGALIAETGGIFANNLNLRVPGTGFELDVPFTSPAADAGRRIPLADLEVVLDDTSGLLALRSRRLGQAVQPVHTGLMGEFWLPGPVRHLIEMFGPPPSLLHSRIPLFFPPGDPGGGGVYRLPRLRAGRIILSRACWALSTAEIPARRSGDSDAHHWLRMADWLAGHGVPERFYVKVIDLNGGPAWTPEAKARKPLYVDLSVWFLVRLLERVLTEGGTLAVLTEALPDLDQAPQYADGRHVTEFLVELSGRVA
jgi:lantibiotic biosynthesis dehydratase-like protein